jgi:hypothetical protein
MGSFWVDNAPKPAPPTTQPSAPTTTQQTTNDQIRAGLPPNYHLPGGPNLNPQGDFSLGGFQQAPANQPAQDWRGTSPDGTTFIPPAATSGQNDPSVSTQPQPYQQGPGGSQQPQGDPKSIALQYAQSLGPPSPENIQKTADYMKSLGFNVQANPGSDGFFLNGVGVDMVSNFHGQGPSNWQFLPDSPISGSGGASAGSGYGGVQTLGGMGGGSGLTPTQQIEQTPGYQFSVDQAKGAIEHSAAARGTLLSGGLMKNLGSYIANAVAGPAYQQRVSNLYGLSNLGFNAANQTGGFGSSFAGGASGALGGIGDATANGIVGASNAGANATNQVLNGIGQIQWPWNKPKVPTPGLPAPTTTSQYPGKVPGDG